MSWGMPSKSIKPDAMENLCYSLILSIPLLTQAYSLPQISKIAFLIGLYVSTQSLTIPCPQSNQSGFLKTKQIVSCLYCKPPMTCCTTKNFLQVLLSPSSCCTTVVYQYSPMGYCIIHFYNTLSKSNLKACIPSLSAESNSPSYDLSMESSFYREFILT